MGPLLKSANCLCPYNHWSLHVQPKSLACTTDVELEGHETVDV